MHTVLVHRVATLVVMPRKAGLDTAVPANNIHHLIVVPHESCWGRCAGIHREMAAYNDIYIWVLCLFW